MDTFHACMIGGALGDAMGKPLEFIPLPETRDKPRRATGGRSR